VLLGVEAEPFITVYRPRLEKLEGDFGHPPPALFRKCGF
jgi:hypothetical protein